MWKSHTERAHTAHGLATIWVMLVGVLLLGVLALVIDIGRQQVILRQLQGAVDGASLSAARYLDGTEEGWRRSKRAMVAALRSQTIRGYGSLEEVSFTAIDMAEGDPLEPGLDYRREQAQVGNVTITFERGVYWQSDTGEFEFLSMDDKPIAPVQGRNMRVFNGMPVHLISNAARATIQVSGLFGSFSRILGVQTLQPFDAQGISVVGQELEECVAPFAIPACALFLDLDPESSTDGGYNFLTSGYRPFNAENSPGQGSDFIPGQCFREVLLTEADPHENPELDDGRVRYQAYVRQPEYQTDGNDACYAGGSSPPGGYGLNCRSVPLYGTMGTTDASGAGFTIPANPADIENALRYYSDEQRCVRARVGSRFRPFEFPKATTPPSMLGVRNQLRQLVRTSSDRLPRVNGRTDLPLGSDLNDQRALKNFPFPRWAIRSSHGDRDERARLGPYVYDLFGDGGEPERDQYPNPMCADANINPNPANPTRRAKKLKFAVITNLNESRPYCEFNDLFSFVPQVAQPPDLDSKPVVIGFVEAKVFDWNFNTLTDPAPPRPPVRSDNMFTSMLMTQISNNQYWRQYVNYVQEFTGWQSCTSIPRCDAEGEPAGFCRTYDCPGQPGFDGVVDEADWNAMRQCYSLPAFDIINGCAVEGDTDDCNRLYNQAVNGGMYTCRPGLWPFGGWWLLPPLCLIYDPCDSNDPNCWGYPTAEAKNNRYRCLPKKKPYIPFSNTLDAWESPRPREPQRGCFGIRARLECSEESLSLTSLTSLERRAPVIVP